MNWISIQGAAKRIIVRSLKPISIQNAGALWRDRLQLDYFKAWICEKRFRSLKDTFLGSFDIDLDHDRLRVRDNGVEPLQADHSHILVIGSRNSVHGVATDSERNFTLLRSQGAFMDLYIRVQTVDRNVSPEALHGAGVWLKRPRFCPANARTEHGVSAHIRSNVQKQIALSKKVKSKHHVCKLMQTNVDVLGCPSHAVPDCQSLSSDPVENNLVLKPAA
jgi:hypothetical protein